MPVNYTWEKTQASTPEQVFHNKVFESSNPFPEFKLGQSIAKLDDLRLHRKIEGYPNGVPRSKLNYHDNEAYREYEPQAYEVYARKLRDIHAFPQKSYTDLAHFLVRLKASDPPVSLIPRRIT